MAETRVCVVVPLDALSQDSDVTLIIPVFRDAAALLGLDEQIAALRPQPAGVIVVSGGPAEPAVTELCALRDYRLLSTEANRGMQLDVGARAAHSGILWFVHADSELPGNAITAIHAAMATGAAGGCFRFRFAGRRRLPARAIEAGVALRIALGGMIYGDQGIFAARAVYLATGGFRRTPLFEEVALVRALRRNGGMQVLSLPIGVSARRFERDGWLRRSLHNRWLALCYLCGQSPERLAARYRKPQDA